MVIAMHRYSERQKKLYIAKKKKKYALLNYRYFDLKLFQCQFLKVKLTKNKITKNFEILTNAFGALSLSVKSKIC